MYMCFSILLPTSGFSALPLLLHPKSRGSVTLRSPNPLHNPVIQPNYLTHPDDIAALLEVGIWKIRPTALQLVSLQAIYLYYIPALDYSIKSHGSGVNSQLCFGLVFDVSFHRPEILLSA